MGAWGTGIFDDDTTCDVRDDFIDYLEEGKTVVDATQIILEEYLDEYDLNDDLEVLSLVYIGLSAIQLGKNCLLDHVKLKTIELIERGADLELWKESDDADYENRKVVLSDFKEKLLNSKRDSSKDKHPKPKKKKDKIKYELGSIFTIHFNKNCYAYGQLVHQGIYGDVIIIFDCTSEKVSRVNEIIQCDILFCLSVDDEKIKNRKWKVIGETQIPKKLKLENNYLIEELRGPIVVDINGNFIRKATVEEENSLPTFDSYSPSIVEDLVNAKFGNGEWEDYFNEMIYKQ